MDVCLIYFSGDIWGIKENMLWTNDYSAVYNFNEPISWLMVKPLMVWKYALNLNHRSVRPFQTTK
jgi:hypothetical protein